MNTKTTAGSTPAERMFGVLKKRWYVVVLSAFLAGTAAFAVSTQIAPTYRSEASLFFSLRDGDSGTDINQGLTYTQNQMLSYAELATTATVLDRAAETLDTVLPQKALQRAVTVTTPQNTVILKIQSTTTDPQLSADIANGVAESLKDVVSEVAPTDASGKPTVTARVIQPAQPATIQSSPNKSKNALLGAFAGGGIALVVAFLIVIFDTKIRSIKALKSVTDHPVLGVAERTLKSSDVRPIAIRAPHSSATERYRQLRASLRFTSVSHELSTIAITSSIPGEGKSVTALNLALTMAEGAERILLIDADLRRPRVAHYLGLEPAVGLTTVIVGGLALTDAVQRFSNTRLDVLTSGDIPPNPSELLDSQAMQRLLNQAKESYDVVILDTAPVLSVSDAAIVAQRVDSTVVVIDSTRIRFAQLEQTTDLLEAAGVHISGLVLNKVKVAAKKGGYYAEADDSALRGPSYRGQPRNNEPNSRALARKARASR
ncbi:polysaccharide biosynthesis tyrosine autokinase [Arthrobacter sp.]|uniref:polysaccharide biosynthesis tyrosine autokinase n=1 Tax=Arthrobacter sp. TaxID=1667 RepID=UPI003A944EF5